ncbi:MAG: ABC transporter permease [Clostridiales Family XIII bacterium]|jgi:ribose transport system permease protein|nr:ABC transporter permease [Clostridiales Family XIII bacterium]
MKGINIKLSDVVPFIAFAAIFTFFAVASNGIMFSPYNLKLLISQSLITIIVGCGALFVVAQGSIDLSVGVNLALSAVIGTHLSVLTGSSALLMVVTVVIAGGIGLLNGFLVSKCGVPSFMVTIAMLIGLRGVVNYIQTIIHTEHIPDSMAIFSNDSFRIPLFLVIVAILFYLFEFTKLGKYSRAIGENEVAARSVGVPVTKMKIIAFLISGLAVGIGAIFSLTQINGTSNTMGVFFEMQVAMAIYLGGVLVTGGSSAKIYKVILGSFSITIIVNGLAITGNSDSQISESVEGFLLLLILFLTIVVNKWSVRRASKAAVELAE